MFLGDFGEFLLGFRLRDLSDFGDFGEFLLGFLAILVTSRWMGGYVSWRFW